MRKNFGSKPFVYPQPVFIISTYDENGIVDAMNAAWGCIADYKKIGMYLDARHKTVKNILFKKAFTVSMATVDYVVESDYVGIVSGNDVPNKVDIAGWHTMKSEFVDAPIIEELPLTLECEFESYDEESELMIGKIINVSADECILTKDKIDPSKLNPITYDPVNHKYIALGETVGNAFKDGNKLKG